MNSVITTHSVMCWMPTNDNVRRTVGLSDNDKGASPDLREQIVYM